MGDSLRHGGGPGGRVLAHPGRWALAAMAASASLGAQAQASSVTLYGAADAYFNYMHSSSGKTTRGLENGAYEHSQIGVRGVEDIGDGFTVKFQFEGGLSVTTGAADDPAGVFNRQTWVGMGSPWGEVRIGRQETTIFHKGIYIDFTARTMGSLVGEFGVPARYDRMISYASPRWGGLQVDVQASVPGTPTGGVFAQSIYLLGLDYLNGPFRVGYGGLRAKPPSGAPYGKQVFYDNLYTNWDYGRGTVYLTYVRSNISTSSGSGANEINNGGTILGQSGGVVAGTNPDVNRTYNVWQVSADYHVTPRLRIGAQWGWVRDTSGSGRNASGGTIGGYYYLSKRTILLALVDTVRNGRNAGFRILGTGMDSNFTTSQDVNGRNIFGVQLGMVHSF